jgi:hypothetical protein
MSVDFEWLVPQHISYARFAEEVTVAQLEITNTLMVSYARQVPAPRTYHAVFDCLATDEFPLRISVLMQDHLASYSKEPNMGYIVVITANPVMQLVGSIVLRLRHTNFHMARNLEDGLGFLRVKDTSIRWENAASKFAGKQ